MQGGDDLADGDPDHRTPGPVLSMIRGATYRIALIPGSWWKKAIRKTCGIGAG